MTTIKTLAKELVASDLTHLDAVVCNAGIGGWSGMDWLTCFKDVALDIRNNTTYPSYKIGIVGAVTKKQISQDEPALGEVFCANVFGHYMLVHWVMPLLRASEKPGRIIWVTTVAPAGFEFSFDDIQALESGVAYESSKRLTDLLALTANQPGSRKYVQRFEEGEGRIVKSRPEVFAFHPGIVVTSVFALWWLLEIGYLMGIYLARLVGGVWSTVHPYSAAHGAVWLALADSEEIRRKEDEAQERGGLVKDGRIKWGTSVNAIGTTSVRHSDTDGWGIRGTGVEYMKTWWAGKLGRRPGSVEATPESVKAFLADGEKAWKMMEDLRKEWEDRLANAKVRS